MNASMLNLEIDREDPTPIHYQIRRQIQTLITSNILKNDSPLPTEMELVDKYKVSRTVIRQALSDLAKENYIHRIRGKGTFVNKKAGTKLLATILYDVNSSFYAPLVRGIGDFVNDAHFNLILCNCDGNAEKEKTYVLDSLQKKVEGLVITPSPTGEHSYIQELVERKIPLVFVDNYLEGFTADVVTTDNLLGTYKGIEYLLRRGHKRIAFLNDPSDLSVRGRYKGYQNALKEFGVPLPENLIEEISSPYSEEDIYRVIKKILDNSPTAIFAINLQVARGAIRAIMERGLRIPQDIFIAGFDLEIDPLLNIPYLTVAQQRYEMGRKAAQLLVEKIKGKRKTGDVQYILLEPHIKIHKPKGITR